MSFKTKTGNKSTLANYALSHWLLTSFLLANNEILTVAGETGTCWGSYAAVISIPG